MTTRNRRKRNPKTSRRWREFMMIPGPAVDNLRDAVPVLVRWDANCAMPAWAVDGVWSTGTWRHAL